MLFAEGLSVVDGMMVKGLYPSTLTYLPDQTMQLPRTGLAVGKSSPRELHGWEEKLGAINIAVVIKATKMEQMDEDLTVKVYFEKIKQLVNTSSYTDGRLPTASFTPPKITLKNKEAGQYLDFFVPSRISSFVL